MGVFEEQCSCGAKFRIEARDDWLSAILSNIDKDRRLWRAEHICCSSESEECPGSHDNTHCPDWHGGGTCCNCGDKNE